MTAPAFIRRWRTRLSDAQTNRLRAQLAAERDRSRRLEQRLAGLQAANEGAYRALREHTGGARFEPTQPVGSQPRVSLTKEQAGA
ncbi:hypothetical protein [Streptomyces roseochromogenus]|uniref:Uncharacterized protein n=1 Tax=Streptomyces roseochromogenus subsp. oscitans DS 12.976 TaxID=1352936 RepID=V6K698_STRRC|nr:hypothetical protein [Streptomyces roseochromogenus]EST24504.1 hypothetical protein M878_30525 [Streptomyces roseochromogenus subsp. oscitans DS 12.976]